MPLRIDVRDLSLLEHVFIVLGDDWRVSGLRDRHLLHGGQSDLHRCVIIACSLIGVCILLTQADLCVQRAAR